MHFTKRQYTKCLNLGTTLSNDVGRFIEVAQLIIMTLHYSLYVALDVNALVADPYSVNLYSFRLYFSSRERKSQPIFYMSNL